MFCVTGQKALQYINRKKTAIALGSFDGLHIGHQALIRTVIAEKENGYLALLHNYTGRPEQTIQPDKAILSILTNQDKCRLLEEMGMDGVIFEEFNETFMKLSPKQFIEDYLIARYHAGLIVVGQDYRFGYHGKGDAQMLKTFGEKMGFRVIILDKVMHDNKEVSSSRIRSLIQLGNLQEAYALLSRYFFITNTVQPGKKLGRKLGFPTANIKIPAGIIVPPNGVYISQTTFNHNTYKSITNIGTQPTVNGKEKNVETFLLNFEGLIYNKEIKVDFIQRIRPEKKFESVEALRAQVLEDIEYCKNFQIS